MYKHIANVINTEIPYPLSEMDEDYAAKFHLKEKQEQMLSILEAFDELCRKNGVFYSLADGTLLGAMRHGDYIPWDDDADVMMTRTQYEKLLGVVGGQRHLRLVQAYFLDRLTTDVLLEKGVYVDLFINDDLPQTNLRHNGIRIRSKILRTYFDSASMENVRRRGQGSLRKGMVKWVGQVFGGGVYRVFREKDIWNVHTNIIVRHKRADAKTCTRYTSRMYEMNRRFDKKNLIVYADAFFHGKRLMALQNADGFLKEMYGNYMALPPKEKRVAEHGQNILLAPSKCLRFYNGRQKETEG